MSGQEFQSGRLMYASYLIMPHEAIAQVSGWQRMFAETFGFRNAVMVKPYLHFSDLYMCPEGENMLLNILQEVSQPLEPMKVILSGFDELDDSALCVRAENDQKCLKYLVPAFKNFKNRLEKEAGVSELSLPVRLQVKIAGGLTGEQLKMVKREWKAEDFTAEFYVEGLRLVRDSFRGMEFLRDFRFGGHSELLLAGGYGRQISIF